MRSKSRLLTGWNGTRKLHPHPLSDPVARAPAKAFPGTAVVAVTGREDWSVVISLNCQLLMRWRARALLLAVNVGLQTKLIAARCRISFAAEPFSAAKLPFS